MRQNVNLYEQVIDRSGELTQELWEMDNGTTAENTRTPNGDFDHRAWIEAENEATAEERERLVEVIGIDSHVKYG